MSEWHRRETMQATKAHQDAVSEIGNMRKVIVRQQAEIERLKAVLHGREHWCDCDSCRKAREGVE